MSEGEDAPRSMYGEERDRDRRDRDAAYSSKTNDRGYNGPENSNRSAVGRGRDPYDSAEDYEVMVSSLLASPCICIGSPGCRRREQCTQHVLPTDLGEKMTGTKVVDVPALLGAARPTPLLVIGPSRRQKNEHDRSRQPSVWQPH
jgi:hypothetical protein